MLYLRTQGKESEDVVAFRGVVLQFDDENEVEGIFHS